MHLTPNHQPINHKPQTRNPKSHSGQQNVAGHHATRETVPLNVVLRQNGKLAIFPVRPRPITCLEGGLLLSRPTHTSRAPASTNKQAASGRGAACTPSDVLGRRGTLIPLPLLLPRGPRPSTLARLLALALLVLPPLSTHQRQGRPPSTEAALSPSLTCYLLLARALSLYPALALPDPCPPRPPPPRSPDPVRAKVSAQPHIKHHRTG